MKNILEGYKNTSISKGEYIEEMHKKHQCLFEYSVFIKATNIKEISITDDQVIMTTRERDIKLICDRDDKRNVPIEILNFGDYEKECMDMMLRLIKPGDIIVDIGANIGWYSLNLAKSINNIQIHAFEPIPRTFDYLTRNLALNNIVNVNAHNLGISEEAKELTFYYDSEDAGSTSINNLLGKENIQQVKGQVITLDHFISYEKTAVDFIKCDVEGAELLVLKGSEETLKTHKPIVFAEMLRKWALKFNYHPNQIIEFMNKLGYHCFIMKNGSLEAFHVMNEQTVETNFIFLHNEKHCELIGLLTQSR